MKVLAHRLFYRLLQVVRAVRSRIKGDSLKLGQGVQVSNHRLVKLGPRVSLGEYVRLRGRISIGSDSGIRSYVYLDARDGEIVIGRWCSVNDYCVLYGMGGITIGDNVRIATHTVIISGNHRFDDPETLIRLQGVDLQPIVIEDDTWIGANVTILGGIRIGRGSIIGAGSVVTRSFPAMSVIVGNPARLRRKRGD